MAKAVNDHDKTCNKEITGSIKGSEYDVRDLTGGNDEIFGVDGVCAGTVCEPADGNDKTVEKTRGDSKKCKVVDEKDLTDGNGIAGNNQTSITDEEREHYALEDDATPSSDTRVSGNRLCIAE